MHSSMEKLHSFQQNNKEIRLKKYKLRNNALENKDSLSVPKVGSLIIITQPPNWDNER